MIHLQHCQLHVSMDVTAPETTAVTSGRAGGLLAGDGCGGVAETTAVISGRAGGLLADDGCGGVAETTAVTSGRA